MGNLNEERKFIDEIYKEVIKEDIGRVAEAAPVEKPITVMVKVPMEELAQIKASIEKANGGQITDLPLLATELVNSLIQEYFTEEYVSLEDFQDLVVPGDQPEVSSQEAI